MDKIVGTSDMKKVTDLKGKSSASFRKFLERGYDRRQKSGLNINGIQQITLFIYLPIWYNGQRLRDSLGGFSMAEKRTTYKIQDLGGIGEVQIADEVVAIIAGLAATEVDGVASMAGNITNELVSKLGMKNLSKGVKVTVLEGVVTVDLNLNIEYGRNILETSKKVQEKVKSSIENMTGLEVADVNIHIASVDMENEKGK